MRYLKWAFLGLLAIALLTVALANREPVLLRLLPDSMGSFLGLTWAISVPLFVPVFGGIVAGLLIGFVWEWFREHKHRAEATAQKREKARLEREVERLREKEPRTEKDEVLALLEAGPAR